MDESTIKFLEELEAKRGGKVTYRTYATWYADSYGNLREYGVFLYKVNDVYYYEDFERQPSIFGFKLPERKNKPKYEKLEGRFTSEDIVSQHPVLKSKAIRAIQGQISYSALKEPHGIVRFFGQLVNKIELSDGRVYFFELMSSKDRL